MLLRFVGETDRTEPSVDPIQDLTMTMAEHSNGRTTIAFTRPRVTSEAPFTDIALNHSIYILWASGPVNFNPLNIVMHSSRGSSAQRIDIPSAAECPPIGKDDYRM